MHKYPEVRIENDSKIVDGVGVSGISVKRSLYSTCVLVMRPLWQGPEDAHDARLTGWYMLGFDEISFMLSVLTGIMDEMPLCRVLGDGEVTKSVGVRHDSEGCYEFKFQLSGDDGSFVSLNPRLHPAQALGLSKILEGCLMSAGFGDVYV